MTPTIVVERRFEPPLSLAALAENGRQGAWCMEQHRVRHLCSLLAYDGMTLLCAFAAPDAEAVRSVLRTLGSPPARVWPGTVHHPGAERPGPAAGDSLAVVERSFPEPVAFADIQAMEDRGAWCLEQHRVRFLWTWFATDHRRMLCIYAAPDADAVRDAQAGAGMPVDRVWPAHLFEPAASEQPNT